MAIHNNCNYVNCKYNLLLTVQCSDTSCNNWIHHMCQNEYDNSKCNTEFDMIHNLKKRCKMYVDTLMESFVNSVHKEREHHNLLFKKNVPDENPNNNQPGQVIIICKDNEEDVNMKNNEDTEEVNNNINLIDESVYNKESNDYLNDEDDSIDLKIVCDSENKGKGINDIYEKSL